MESARNSWDKSSIQDLKLMKNELVFESLINIEQKS